MINDVFVSRSAYEMRRNVRRLVTFSYSLPFRPVCFFNSRPNYRIDCLPEANIFPLRRSANFSLIKQPSKWFHFNRSPERCSLMLTKFTIDQVQLTNFPTARTLGSRTFSAPSAELTRIYILIKHLRLSGKWNHLNEPCLLAGT